MRDDVVTPPAAEELLPVAAEIERYLRSIRGYRRRAQMGALKGDMDRMALTAVQMQAMELLTRSDVSGEGLSLKALSERLGLAHSTTSGVVDRLERQGLVHRAINPDDRRQIRILVAEEVRDFMRNTWPRIALAPFVRALGGATESERAKVLEGLGILDRLLAESSEADAREAGS